MKKFLAILVAVMLLAASMSALADELPKYTVTLTTLAGHTYEIYQVFTGKIDTDGKTFTELKYGKNAKGTEGDFLSKDDLAALKAIQDQDLKDEHAIIAAYSEFVNFSDPKTTVPAGTTASIELESGYYVIRDVDDKVPDGNDYKNDTTTLYMFTVLNKNIETSTKSGTVESEKKVDDVNDTTGEKTLKKDSADYDIGDTIPYTLTFKLPDNYAKFDKYYLKFSDDMSAGLTLNADSVKIDYAGKKTENISFTTGGTSSLGGTVYTYEIKDLKTLKDDNDEVITMEAGDVITITYSAYLNDNAVIGSTGNPNEYTVEFDNNPNNAGDGKPHGNTPKDRNIVFTYKTVFNKIDENEQPLDGADFKLEKKVNGKWVDVTTLGGSAHPEKVGSSAQKSKTFEFKGLDDGDYRLTETFTPAGYNTIGPIVFTITAEHDLVSDDPQLTALTGTDGKEFTMTPSTGDGSLTSSIMNKSGAVLPSTGGIGTTIFYVAGSILVLAAAILLVTKRRMGAND